MAQFDVYRNPDPESREWAPHIVDLQHDMLSALGTRIMAPLLVAKPNAEPVMQHLNPVVTFEGVTYFLSTSEMAAVPVNALSEAIGSISSHRDELMAAVDLLFTAI